MGWVENFLHFNHFDLFEFEHMKDWNNFTNNVLKVEKNDDQALTCIHGEISVEMTANATLDSFFRHVTSKLARVPKYNRPDDGSNSSRFGTDSRLVFIDAMKM